MFLLRLPDVRRLIALDKQPGVRPVGVGETWRLIFAKIVLKVTGPETTME